MAKQTFTTGQVLTAAQMTSLQQTAMGGGSPVTKTASYVLVAADAGTTIQMNSASATTITVNNSLFAAGDSVQIQNINTGNLVITAGTATVTTSGSLTLGQWEGGFLYFTSSSAAIFFDYTQTGAVSPLTTKGDLWGYSTLDARIPIGTNGQVLTADSTQALGLKWATAASASPASDSATVATNQATNSTSYTDLATAGPSVTLTTGTKALVIVTSRIGVSTSNNYGYHSYAVSGATTIAASDSVAVLSTYPDSNGDARQSSASRLTTLTAGSNTFTSKYRFTGSGTGAYFQAREIIVIDLGS